MEWTLRQHARSPRRADEEAGKRLAEKLRELGVPAARVSVALRADLLSGDRSSARAAFEELKTLVSVLLLDLAHGRRRAYDLISDRGLLTAADKRRIEDNFLRPIGRLEYSRECLRQRPEQILASTLRSAWSRRPGPDPPRLSTPVRGKHAIGHDMLNASAWRAA